MRRTLLILVLNALFMAEAWSQAYVELILDASGSMYNKLEDGRYRIGAAKDALRDFINGLPSDNLNVGLRIYGSQRMPEDDDSCQDSKLFVPLTGFNRNAILSTIRDTRARGSTPIARSLELAALDFPANSDACVVVLVTDGEEVCGGDLQASAKRLKTKGCDIDLRIIGFDLTDKAIESFQGIGTFENATSAGQLVAALDRAVDKVVVTQTLSTATLDAAAEVVAGTGFDVNWEADQGEKDYVTIVAITAEEGTYGSFAYTSSGNPLRLSAPIQPGEYELRYQNDDVAGVGGRRSIRVVATELAMQAPAEIPAGRPFEVEWVGPNGPKDYITIVEVSAADNAYKSFGYTREGSPLRLHASIRPGLHELRYQSDRVKGVFGRRLIRVLPAEIHLEAPASVTAGARFEVQWQGPDGERDYLTVVPANAPDGKYTSYSYTRDGKTVVLHAPLAQGAFEVRYQSDREDGVFARLPIAVSPLNVRIDAPTAVDAGASFEVTWQGPNGESDYVTIVPDSAQPGVYLEYHYTTEGNSLNFKAPSEPGRYELRYQSDREKNVVLGSQPIQVR